jgi:hypothetical protein
VAQEELLERRRRAAQGPHAEAGQVPQDVVQVVGLDVEAHPAVLDRRVVDARQGLQPGDRAGSLDRDRGPGEVAQLGQAPLCTGAAVPDDADPVAERLRLGQDVARQQHGAALVADLADVLLEHRLHERVEARRRLVQDQQLGVGGQRGHERDLLPVALRVAAGLLRRVEVEALEQLRPPAGSMPPRSRPSRSMASPPEMPATA